jgi:pimeloyl-ACP methyl ester carboxylesterase
MPVRMSVATRVVGAAMVALFTVPGWIGSADATRAPSLRPESTTTGERPLPPPVQVRPEPEGVTLADPAFEPLPGARADFGRLGGAVYQIEIPANWNRRLVLHMHGFEELGPEASATAPDFRGYLIAQGYAWGASSFSSTSSIPGRSADETAALWDYFAAMYGRPDRTYVTGISMGGAATHIAAERYPDRFDGGLGLCGSAGQTPGAENLANFFVAAAYAAGVTQAEYDATSDLGALIQDRIRPALRDPQVRKTFENVMLDLTGGPRRFGRAGFRLEEETNWTRAELLVAAKLAPNRDTRYRLGPLSPVTSDEFNRAVIRLPGPTGDQLTRNFYDGEDTTGKLRIPVVTLHSTGDGQVPIEQARIYRRRVERAGQGDLLVQRVIGDLGHCGFRTTEMEAGFGALVEWVEQGKKPKGTNVLVNDLRRLGRTFELSPRPGTPEADAVRGARDRAVIRGRATVDGQPFDARFLGAIVRRNGLMTPCQYTLSAVRNGRYEITVLADAEASGCGAEDAEVILWTFVEDEQFHSTEAVRWPGDGRTTSFNASFSTATPDGSAHPRSTAAFVGEAYDRRGRHMPPGTRVEAYVGDTRCGVASVRRTGSFSGYTLTVVGPDSVAGCEPGATLTFRLDGRPAANTAVNARNAESSLDLSLG